MLENSGIRKNPYRVLGVKATDSKDSIHAVYRKLSKQYHPDSPSGDANKFREVKEAWEQIDKYHSELVGMQFAEDIAVFIHTSLFNIQELKEV